MYWACGTIRPSAIACFTAASWPGSTVKSSHPDAEHRGVRIRTTGGRRVAVTGLWNCTSANSSSPVSPSSAVSFTPRTRRPPGRTMVDQTPTSSSFCTRRSTWNEGHGKPALHHTGPNALFVPIPEAAACTTCCLAGTLSRRQPRRKAQEERARHPVSADQCAGARHPGSHHLEPGGVGVPVRSARHRLRSSCPGG